MQESEASIVRAAVTLPHFHTFHFQPKGEGEGRVNQILELKKKVCKNHVEHSALRGVVTFYQRGTEPVRVLLGEENMNKCQSLSLSSLYPSSGLPSDCTQPQAKD